MPIRRLQRWRRSVSRLYPRLRFAVLKGPRPLFWVLLRVLPPRQYAVVHGWPTMEGNVVELLPILDGRYGHQVFWLVDDDLRTARRFVAQRRLTQVAVVSKKSFRAVWLALTAEATFFTHGLFTAVSPPTTRLVVNLWHGDGPKTTTHEGYISSTVAVTGARMWQEYKAKLFRLRVDDVAWTGN